MSDSGCFRYPTDGFEFRQNTANPIRCLEFFLSASCLGFAIYVTVVVRYIPFVFLIIIDSTAGAYTAITMYDSISTCSKRPIPWNSWIMFALNGGLFFGLSTGLFAVPKSGLAKEQIIGEAINAVTSVVYFLDCFRVLCLTNYQRKRVKIETKSESVLAVFEPEPASKLYPVDSLTGVAYRIHHRTGLKYIVHGDTGEQVKVDPKTRHPILIDPVTDEPFFIHPRTTAHYTIDEGAGLPYSVEPLSGHMINISPITNAEVSKLPNGDLHPLHPNTSLPYALERLWDLPRVVDLYNGQVLKYHPITKEIISTDVNGEPYAIHPATLSLYTVYYGTFYPYVVDPENSEAIRRTDEDIATNPNTNVPYPVHPSTDLTYDFETETNELFAVEPMTGEPLKINPRTSKEIPSPYLVHPKTGLLYSINDQLRQPYVVDVFDYNPITENPRNGRTIPNDKTGKPFLVHPNTGLLYDMDERTQQPYAINPRTLKKYDEEPRTNAKIPIDPESGQRYLMHPKTHQLYSKDKDCILPHSVNIYGEIESVNPRTREIIKIDPETNKPYYVHPATGLCYGADGNLGIIRAVEPSSGQPLATHPNTGLQIPIDLTKKQLYFVDPATSFFFRISQKGRIIAVNNQTLQDMVNRQTGESLILHYLKVQDTSCYPTDPRSNKKISTEQLWRGDGGIYCVHRLPPLDSKTFRPLSPIRLLCGGCGDNQPGTVNLFIRPKTGAPLTCKEIKNKEFSVYYCGNLRPIDPETSVALTVKQIRNGHPGLYFHGCGVLLDPKTGVPLTCREISKGESGVFYPKPKTKICQGPCMQPEPRDNISWRSGCTVCARTRKGTCDCPTVENLHKSSSDLERSRTSCKCRSEEDLHKSSSDSFRSKPKSSLRPKVSRRSKSRSCQCPTEEDQNKSSDSSRSRAKSCPKSDNGSRESLQSDQRSNIIFGDPMSSKLTVTLRRPSRLYTISEADSRGSTIANYKPVAYRNQGSSESVIQNSSGDEKPLIRTKTRSILNSDLPRQRSSQNGHQSDCNCFYCCNGGYSSLSLTKKKSEWSRSSSDCRSERHESGCRCYKCMQETESETSLISKLKSEENCSSSSLQQISSEFLSHISQDETQAESRTNVRRKRRIDTENRIAKLCLPGEVDRSPRI